ncbi:MAG: hypothetical protein RL038_1303 [Actinomycetota bacterium]
MQIPHSQEFATDLVERPTPVKFRDVRALFSRVNFVKLVGVRIFGQTGDGMVQAALTSFVLFSPESQPTAAAIATAFAILLLPYSVFGPLIGTLIDRWPRQRILFYSSLVRAVSVLLVAAVVKSENEGALLGFVVLLSLGVGRFILAALSAALPHVARDHELTTANAFAPTAGTLSSALGALIGVAISRLAGEPGPILVLVMAAVLQLTAATVASRIGRNLLGPESIVKGLRAQLFKVFVELKSGFQHLLAAPTAWRALALVVWHRHVFGMASVWVLILLRNAINPTIDADRALVEFATTVGAAAAGALIGAALAPLMVGKFGTRRWSTLVLLTGTPFVGLGFTLTISDPEQVSAVIGILIAGGFLGWIGQSVKVCGDTVIQAAIDDDHRGRVFALYDMAVNAGLLSGIVVAAGFLPADGVAIWPAIYMTALLFLAPLILRVPPSK